MDKIEKIFVVGGTHGNEYTGAYIIKNWDKIFQKIFLQSKIEIIPLLSNPKAFSNGVRYIDKDLNRVFYQDNLNDTLLTSYENERAKTINNIIGPKPNNTNFIIDTHTTNASMGITIMTSTKDMHKLNLIKYLSKNINNIYVIFTEDNNIDRPFLNSITKHSLLVEIGNMANNVLHHDAFEKTKKVIELTVDYLNKLRIGTIEIEKNITIPIYSIVKKVNFPRDSNGNLTGMIHKDIQGMDYIKKIDKNTNIFMLFDGTPVTLSEGGEYYMSFVNESAYYKEDVAFYIMKKFDLSSEGLTQQI